MLLGPLDDRVAVDDDDAMVAAVVEEALADPPEVAADLLVEGDSRADSGMDEQIVAEAEAVVHLVEEADVALRHLADQPLHDRGRSRVQHPAGGEAVALGAFGAAIGQPVLDARIVAAEDAEEEFLVIALEEDVAGESGRARDEQVDDSAAVGTAVDEVAEEDQPGLGRPAPRIVLLDPGEQVDEEVEPAVDVADRIGAAARRAASAPGRPALRKQATQH